MHEYLMFALALFLAADGIFNTEIKNAHPLFRTDLFGIHCRTIGNILGNARYKI